MVVLQQSQRIVTDKSRTIWLISCEWFSFFTDLVARSDSNCVKIDLNDLLRISRRTLFLCTAIRPAIKKNTKQDTNYIGHGQSVCCIYFFIRADVRQRSNRYYYIFFSSLDFFSRSFVFVHLKKKLKLTANLTEVKDGTFEEEEEERGIHKNREPMWVSGRMCAGNFTSIHISWENWTPTYYIWINWAMHCYYLLMLFYFIETFYFRDWRFFCNKV